jgi:hypothetical protein
MSATQGIGNHPSQTRKIKTSRRLEVVSGQNHHVLDTVPSPTCVGSINEPRENLALLASLPMFFLGAAPSYASRVRVGGF